MRQLLWLRNDLRTTDHSALHHAMQQGPTLALYVLSPGQWTLHDDATIKLDFRLRSLQKLAERLQQLNVPLIVIQCDVWRALPQRLLELCQHWHIGSLHFNDEYGVNEQLRDRQCSEHLQAAGIQVHRHGDSCLFTPGSLRTQQGQMFQVFTAFKKACWQRLHTAPLSSLPPPLAQAATGIASQLDALQPYLAHNAEWERLWPAGEAAAWQQLEDFCQYDLYNYQQERDFPALDSTSRLSPALACGLLSVRSCWQRAVLANQGEFDSGSEGVVTWLTELLWREFYQHLLALNPRLSKGEAFLAVGARIPWHTNAEQLHAWQQGQTGFPLIDAAMRQLAATGWMHNRLRMVVAMFFCKNLLLDWRLGERWFMQHLIDGDLAANNGGWQWCASIGTDAAPYFRVFNPVTQSQRFDPKGDFIRRWLPELAHLDDRQIHLPQTGKDLFASHYPAAMVDLKSSRARAIAVFKQAGQATV
ncbi:MAG: deoxyribodipyrimidine photo-lyase [Thiopseudomonas sp.]|nr:deoxyribodipyrimidine photo-lyase [Thiopseudomonas sp.]